MHTRTKQLWAMMTAMTLVVACLVPVAAANRTSDLRICTALKLVSDATTLLSARGRCSCRRGGCSSFHDDGLARKRGRTRDRIAHWHHCESGLRLEFAVG